MNITKHIPNAITSLNVLSGCIAVIFALQGDYYAVAICIALSAIFDFCDGFAARLLQAYSPMGKELDSLADLISFGLAPALLVLSSLQNVLPVEYKWVAYISLILPVFAALRLAKFNIDERQSTSFIGLPVPANALWWIGVSHIFTHPETVSCIELWGVVISIPVFAVLMISELPMFSLKFSNYRLSENVMRYTLIVVSIVCLVWQGVAGFALIIGIYILMSIYAAMRK